MKSKILHSATFTLAAAILVLTLLLFPVGPMPIANADAPPDPMHLTADYTLNSDMIFSGTGFIIDANNITLDLNGHTITGSYSGALPYHGVSVSGHTGVTLRMARFKVLPTELHFLVPMEML